MSYSFYCSKCKFDHAGECKTLVQRAVEAADGQMVDNIKELIKVLESLGLDKVPPGKLHQCKQDGSCGCLGFFSVDGDTVKLTCTVKLETSIEFIPISFQLSEPPTLAVGRARNEGREPGLR